ncbi:hypothetical protein [Reichenbachiella versicolor]|uniref:hypothetical protein n=1 Tax=Reichenbachiella versicolor TaxID=1821036 RepID=UPI0013A55250|nr:hypothetical protein [Reichenbachiella versicolor]
MRYIYLIALIVLSSCKTEEDKYPEMAVFSPDMKGDFVFEKIDPIPTYYRDTDEYVFFITDNSIPQSKVLIYDKESKELIKDLVLANNRIHVDTGGSIYGFDEKRDKAFKYEPPRFIKTFLKTASLSFVNNKSLEKRFSSEIEDRKLEGRELSDFLTAKRYEILKKEFIDSLLCLTQLDVIKSNAAVAHFRNETVYLEESDLLYTGTIIKSALAGVTDCNSSNFDLDGTQYFGESPLSLIDQVTLNYSLDGSNHYVIGVTSKNLYYYELNIDGKSTRFKCPDPIENVKNLEEQVILKTVNGYYKVSIKK